ncbi:MAG: hypothetical protein NTU89_03315, partial [Candidatus Dependentiae bacterium]|nr:hypothetical protein [Candidatus Dependentiae bacterium]
TDFAKAACCISAFTLKIRQCTMSRIDVNTFIFFYRFCSFSIIRSFLYTYDAHENHLHYRFLMFLKIEIRPKLFNRLIIQHDRQINNLYNH